MSSSPRLHLLLERLSNLFRADLRACATAHGLKLVQLEALVYFAVCNRYSDTPQALAEYLGITKGTVSQTLKALERHGLIERRRDGDDARVQHCTLTAAGRAIVEEAYPAGVLRPLDGHVGADAIEATLESTLRALQHGQGLRAFGVCSTCRFHRPRARGGVCGLTGETLTRDDSRRICREHETVESPA